MIDITTMYSRTTSTAKLSPCGKYRYHLTRTWDELKVPMIFVMLNPSTADASQDDPTIRKCMGFAREYNCGGIEVFNLWAFRATSPKHLEMAGWQEGPDNDRTIMHQMAQHKTRWNKSADVILAWGANARRKPERAVHMVYMLQDMGCRLFTLKVLSDGVPAHPLMLPYPSNLEPYKGSGV
jgi:hypothetical protein